MLRPLARPQDTLAIEASAPARSVWCPARVPGRLIAVGLFLLVAANRPLSAVAATNGPVLHGSIAGEVAQGGRITFHLEATEPGGYKHLAKLQMILLLHSVILDQITYDQATDTVSTATSLPVPVGTRNTGSGTFFNISGKDVSKTTGGDRLSLTATTTMAQSAPKGAEFNLGAIDDLAQVARLTRAVNVPEAAGGFSWGTLGLAAAAALFIGGFVGNLFASGRRAIPTVSVYQLIEQHMKQETTAP